MCLNISNCRSTLNQLKHKATESDLEEISEYIPPNCQHLPAISSSSHLIIIKFFLNFKVYCNFQLNSKWLETVPLRANLLRLADCLYAKQSRYLISRIHLVFYFLAATTTCFVVVVVHRAQQVFV